MSNASRSSNSSSSASSTRSSTVGTPPTPSRRGLFFRIGGVILFLALGTFAVTQTMLGQRGKAKHAHGEHNHEQLVEQDNSVATVPPPLKKPLINSTSPALKPAINPDRVAFRNDFAPKTPPSGGFQPKPLKPAEKRNDSNGFSGATNFQVKTGPPVQSPRVPPALQPKRNLPPTTPPNTPVVNNRPIVDKPEIPVVSFGGAPKNAPTPPSSNPFQNTAKQGNDLAAGLRSKTDDLLAKAAAAPQRLAQEANRNLDSFGLSQKPSSGGFQSTPPRTQPSTPPIQRSGSGFQVTPKPPELPVRPTTGAPGASFSQGNLAPLNSNDLRQPVRSTPPVAPTTQSNGFQSSFGQPAPRTTTPPPRSNPVQLPSRGTSTIPTRQASSASPIGPAVAGVRTAPTPGERTLEGTRTPTVSVQRVAPREIQLNTPANFEIIVRNTGRIEANDVRVYDQIPTGTVLLEATPQPTSNDGKAVQWAIGKMAPGQERRIQMKLKPTQPGEIGSVAHVTFATRSSVRTLVTKPELTITHSAPERSLIGDAVKLDIVVTNNGNGPANDVIIQEDVPAQLEYPDGFRNIEYPLGVLAPGQSRKLQLNLRAADVGRLQNVVSVSGAGGLRAKHSINMEIVAPKLVANSDGPRKRYLRRQATHDFTVQNNGTAAATNVEMMAKLPPGLRFVSANNQGQYDPNTNAVYWSMAELAPQSPAAVSVTTVPVDTGNQDIAFTAVADLKQKVTTEAGLVVEHLVDVFFDIDDVIDHIEVGSETSYQLRVVNQGTKTATNVQLVVDMPPGIRPLAVQGGLEGQVRGQQVAFAPITSMNPGDEIKVAVTATGVAPGEHKVVARMQTDDRQSNVSKEETTQVYSDR